MYKGTALRAYVAEVPVETNRKILMSLWWLYRDTWRFKNTRVANKMNRVCAVFFCAYLDRYGTHNYVWETVRTAYDEFRRTKVLPAFVKEKYAELFS